MIKSKKSDREVSYEENNQRIHLVRSVYFLLLQRM